MIQNRLSTLWDAMLRRFMARESIAFVIGIGIFSSVYCQEVTVPVYGGVLAGELTLAHEFEDGKPLVIIISGSGPTDRNSNQAGQGPRSLGLLADSLAEQGISSFRYDKRGVGASVFPFIKEADIRIDTFVADLDLWVSYWEKDPRFRGIVLAGHSEGALIATLSAQRFNSVCGLISLAGAGRTADTLMMEQFSRQPAYISQAADSLFRNLREGREVNPPPFLASLFHPGILPYMKSWIAYDPAHEISKLDIPTLVISGDQDIQVASEDAKRLHEAGRRSHLLSFENMNHVLKDVESLPDNYLSYQDAQRPLSPGLVKGIVGWIFHNCNP